MTLLVNGLWVVNEQSAVWQTLDTDAFSIDRYTRELVVTPNVSTLYSIVQWSGDWVGGAAGGALTNRVRLVGGKDPVELATDDDETSIPSAFIIAKATQLAFESRGGGRRTDPEGFMQRARPWEVRAELERVKFPRLGPVRRLS